MIENDEPASVLSFTEEEEKIVKGFNLLSLKPALYIANMAEDDLIDPQHNPYFTKLKEKATNEGIEIIPISAQVEYEISALENEEEQAIFMESYGLTQSGLDTVIQSGYRLLGLETYFTCGPMEARAWTFHKGMKAPEAAGIIHTDFERGFIKAEVLSYEDLMLHGSPQQAKEKGRVRIEGKEYVVEDGDIILFRFNV